MKIFDTPIDKHWLDAHLACPSGRRWLAQNTGIGASAKLVLADLRQQKEWANFRWVAVRLMTHHQKLEWAIFCAEQVIYVFEKRRPNDPRPRAAIDAAKAFLENPSKENRVKAWLARRSACAVTDATDAAYAVAYAATAIDSADAAAAAAAYATTTTAAADNADIDATAAYAVDISAYAVADHAREEMRNLCADKALEILAR